MLGIRGIIYSIIASVALFSALFAVFDLVGHLSSPRFDARLKDDLWEYHDDEVLWWPLLVDLCLIWLFIVQHSMMAHPTWKNMMDNFDIVPIQRALYTFLTSATLQTLMYYWLPLPAHPLWFIDTSQRPFFWLFFFIFHAFMWLIVFLSHLSVDLSELLGIKQVYYYLIDAGDPMILKSPSAQKLYSHMRHPSVGPFLLILWVHPFMTLERFFLAFTWTLYLLFGFRVSVQDHVYIKKQVIRKTATMAGTVEITHSY